MDFASKAWFNTDAVLAEDIVQETFLGFLTSLPNYDETTPVETFLCSITRHKIVDQLRRVGRRPGLNDLFTSGTNAGGSPEPAARDRRAASLAQSAEQHDRNEFVIRATLKDLVENCLARGEYEWLKCLELIVAEGTPN